MFKFNARHWVSIIHSPSMKAYDCDKHINNVLNLQCSTYIQCTFCVLHLYEYANTIFKCESCFHLCLHLFARCREV